jgi:tetratricopeptide (TPR) repeat protein
MQFDDSPPAAPDPKDAAQWDAVEEASELLHEERFKDALLVLRDVLKADATNPYAFYFLGIALYESGELEAARDAYRACLKFAPKHLGARVALTHVLRALGDFRASIQEGMIALTNAPGHADVLYAIGMAHLARGDDSAARRFLEAFLQAGPEFESSEEVKELLGRLGGRPS